MGVIMFKVLLFVISLFTVVKIGKEPKIKPIQLANPIYYQILKNNPKIDKKYAMKLSNAIYHVAKLYNINPKRYAAILGQESMYKLDAVNCTKGKCSDFGISQINIKTIKAFKFSITRLTTDLHYSLEAGAIVLADFKKAYGHKEDDWWTRYNTSNKDKREIYKALVVRYL